MRQREYKNDQLTQEVKETSHQEGSVENGASGTDSCDSEFHCPVVAPDSILARDRVASTSSEVKLDTLRYIVMQSEDFEGGWLHEKVFTSFDDAIDYIIENKESLAECDYFTVYAIGINNIHKVYSLHG